jgi:AraC-like DNA-binding protein
MNQSQVSEIFPVAHLPLAVFRTENRNIARHYHEFLELVLVVEGHAQHQLYPPEDEAAHTYEIRANDIFFIPLGWSHSYIQTNNFFIYNILFFPSLLSPALHSCETASRPLQILGGDKASSSDNLLRKIHLRTGERELIEACFREVSREVTLRRSGFELVAQAKMIEALVLVARIATARASGYEAMTVLEAGTPVAKAAAFMEEHFNDTISLEDIASAAHLNPNYLCEIFKATFGISVGSYLSQLRLEHARFLLSTTQIPVTDVADQAGFVDAGYFARVFKASTGQTPREFRSKSNPFELS